MTLLQAVWWFGVIALGVSTKLLYVRPSWYWDRWPSLDTQTTLVCNQSPRPTQPPTLSRMGNEYLPLHWCSAAGE